LGESPIDDCSDNGDDVKLRSHSSNDATTDEEGSGKERGGDLHLPETDTVEEDTDNLGNVT
jgi:hypothetical protein